jgi:hypothetical protein
LLASGGHVTQAILALTPRLGWQAYHWMLEHGTVKRLGVRCWAGYDRPSFWLAGDQGWGGFCAWWKSGLKVPAEAST